LPWSDEGDLRESVDGAGVDVLLVVIEQDVQGAALRAAGEQVVADDEEPVVLDEGRVWQLAHRSINAMMTSVAARRTGSHNVPSCPAPVQASTNRST
jgi:hypothetical protein